MGAVLRERRSVFARSSASSSNTETDIYPLCRLQCCSSTFIFSTIATFYVGWTGARDTWWFFIKRRRCAFTLQHFEVSLSNLAHTQDDLYEYCFRVRRTIQEVLTEFRSAKIPKEYIFDLFPPMRPREFSIASSIKVSPPCLENSMIDTFSFRVRTAPSPSDTFMRCNRQISDKVEDIKKRSVYDIFGGLAPWYIECLELINIVYS
jgi:FAD binding domain